MRLNGASSRLQIYDSRERAVVSAADGVLRAGAALARRFRSRRPPGSPARILLLRLERIGDLVMALPAIADVRALAPAAVIDLVVGSWNRELAGAIAAVSSVRVLDARWLAREGGGLGVAALLSAAREWRRDHYDLAINFEPDIRTNLLLAASGSAWTAGFSSGGGGPLLDTAIPYDANAHTTDNARRLVAAALGSGATAAAGGTLRIPESSEAGAARRLAGSSGPLVGLHVSGGRAIKQWPPERFAEVARRLITAAGATIVLTGTAGDRKLVDQVASVLPRGTCHRCRDRFGLLDVAAILRRLDLFVTGDTGPMHLAAAVGTPVVAVFGPSDPARYAPRGPLRSGRPRRSSVQPVQPHPPSARALRRPHARLPCRRDRRQRVYRRDDGSRGAAGAPARGVSGGMSADAADALGTLIIDNGTGGRQVRLADYLDADAEERAAGAANAWIKALRLAHVDGQPLRTPLPVPRGLAVVVRRAVSAQDKGRPRRVPCPRRDRAADRRGTADQAAARRLESAAERSSDRSLRARRRSQWAGGRPPQVALDQARASWTAVRAG